MFMQLWKVTTAKYPSEYEYIKYDMPIHNSMLSYFDIVKNDKIYI